MSMLVYAPPDLPRLPPPSPRYPARRAVHEARWTEPGFREPHRPYEPSRVFAVREVNQIEVIQTFSSGCGGPSYGWTADGYIAVGGVIKQQALPPGVAQWAPMANEAALRYGLPLQYVLGIMALESGGKADAGSPAGAMGLMQLIKSTANQFAGRTLTVEEIYDPTTNIDLGCKFLAHLWQWKKGDPIKMAFAYNAGDARCGSGCVRDYADKPKMPCIADCSPNQFGLKADCYAANKVTIDYGGRVAAYSNEALATGVATVVPPEIPLGEDEEVSESSGSGLGWVVLGALALGGAYWYTRPTEQKAA